MKWNDKEDEYRRKHMDHHCRECGAFLGKETPFWKRLCLTCWKISKGYLPARPEEPEGKRIPWSVLA